MLFVLRGPEKDQYYGAEAIAQLISQSLGASKTRNSQPMKEDISKILNTRSERKLMEKAFPMSIGFRQVHSAANGHSNEIRFNNDSEMPSVEFVGAKLESARARQQENLTKKAKQEGRV